MGGTKDSMIAGAPRNLTMEESALVRRLPPRQREEDDVAAEPRCYPLRRVEPTALPGRSGPRVIANLGARTGHEVEVYAGVDNDDVVVVCRLDGRKVVVAGWRDGFDVAFGYRQDGSRRVAVAKPKSADAEPEEKGRGPVAQVKDWLNYGVDEHVPAMRDAALMLARGLGARLEMVRDRRDGDKRFLAPVLTDLTVAAHLQRWHRVAPSLVDPMAEHDLLHANGAPLHEHVPRPLGQPGER